MTNLKDKTVCIVDDGMNVWLSERLARDFGRTLLFTPWVSDYPRSQDDQIGTGIPGVERISYFWNYIDEVDLFVFPGLFHGDMQEHLVDLGKRVWGSRFCDKLELDRWEANKKFERLGELRPEMTRIKGIDNLREHLKENDDLYIKISTYRADDETWNHKSYAESEEKLDEIEQKLGKQKHDYEWLLEQPIKGDDIVEAGWDGICIDGQFSQKTIQGFEVKDSCYCAHVVDYKKQSPLITSFNEAVSETLKRGRYRNFMSTEIRVGKDKKPIMIDFTARMPSPPGELFAELCTNLSQVIWHGADGVLIEPEFEAKYGVEVFIDSSFAENKWQSIRFPEKIKRWVKLRNYAIIDGVYCVIPKYKDFDNVGAVVAIGNTLEECFEKVKDYSDQISGHKIEKSLGSIEQLKKVIEKAKAIGINF